LPAVENKESRGSLFERTVDIFDWLLKQNFCDNKIESEVHELKFEF
jgi:hypothetical protein